MTVMITSKRSVEFLAFGSLFVLLISLLLPLLLPATPSYAIKFGDHLKNTLPDGSERPVEVDAAKIKIDQHNNSDKNNSHKSTRLHRTRSYIGKKLRSLGRRLKPRIPRQLKRFFKWPSFLKFKIRHHKVYDSLLQELHRHMVFLESQVLVALQHFRFLMKRDKHLTGANQYADWTESEYVNKLGNPQAERDARQLTVGARVALDPATVLKLRKLEQSGGNIFGFSMEAKNELQIKERRKKRSADYGDDMDEDLEMSGSGIYSDDEDEEEEEEEEFDPDELAETEDDEMEDNNQHGYINNNYGANEEYDEANFKVIDEFANGINLDGLDDIESHMDEALSGNDAFKSIDLRQTGCIIKADNQKSCGCCYSYAMNAAASYYNCMENKLTKPERYHARFVSDCGKYLSLDDSYSVLNGCRGGRISDAFKFIQIVGVHSHKSYNIARVSAEVFEQDNCAYPRPKSLFDHNWEANIKPVGVFQRSRFTLLKLDEVDLHLRTVGPVLVNMKIWKNFKFFAGGILDSFENSSSSLLHTMLIVGHDRDLKGRRYWIILNSHGTSWGEKGCVRIYDEALQNFGVLFGGLAPLE